MFLYKKSFTQCIYMLLSVRVYPSPFCFQKCITNVIFHVNSYQIKFHETLIMISKSLNAQMSVEKNNITMYISRVVNQLNVNIYNIEQNTSITFRTDCSTCTYCLCYSITLVYHPQRQTTNALLIPYLYHILWNVRAVLIFLTKGDPAT